MNQGAAQGLGGAVQQWLDFQMSCKREVLLNESFMSQPIVEFLQAHHNGPTPKEFTIPDLVNSGRGRDRQVDFALLSPLTSRVTSAIETKWVRDSASEKQRLVDDLLRLELFRRHQNQALARYFLIAGKRTPFERNFLNVRVNAPGGRRRFLAPLLLANDSLHTVEVENSAQPWRKYFSDYSKSYGVRPPRRFRTQRVLDIEGTFVRVGVWQVSSVQHRAEVPATW